MNIPVLIGVMIFVIIGVAVALPVVQDQIILAETTNTTVGNESHTVASLVNDSSVAFGTTGTAVTSVTFVANETFVVPTSNYTFNGTHLDFTLLHNYTGADYNFTYVYEPLEYIADNASRTMLAIITILIILFIVIAAAKGMGLF